MLSLIFIILMIGLLFKLLKLAFRIWGACFRVFFKVLFVPLVLIAAFCCAFNG